MREGLVSVVFSRYFFLSRNCFFRVSHTALRIVVAVYQIGESLTTGRCGVLRGQAVECYLVPVVNVSQNHVVNRPPPTSSPRQLQHSFVLSPGFRLAPSRFLADITLNVLS